MRLVFSASFRYEPHARCRPRPRQDGVVGDGSALDEASAGVEQHAEGCHRLLTYRLRLGDDALAEAGEQAVDLHPKDIEPSRSSCRRVVCGFVDNGPFVSA